MIRLTKHLKTTITLALTFPVLTGCSMLDNKAADERWADYRKWTKMNKQPITGDHTGFLGGLHRGKQGVREVFVNDIGASAALQSSGPFNYPIGTVIVKEQYKSMAARDQKKGVGTTIMVKTSDSTPNLPTDWQWSRGYGKPAKDDPFCSGCHTVALTKDFSFSNGESLKEFQ